MIPAIIVTGFLGAGKTTLLQQILRQPAWSNSAIIINEFGEIALDHELIMASDEVLVNVSTGCICCAVRTDLTATLNDLARRRAVGEIPEFGRVLIETPGLADPAPILHALMTDRTVGAIYRFHATVTLVGTLHGTATLDRHPEARRQVILADRILLTKSDLCGKVVGLQHLLRSFNPAAPIEQAAWGLEAPDRLFAAEHVSSFLDATAWHSVGVAGMVIEREAPIPALALTLWMQILAEHAGVQLLRLKGIVALSEAPETPVVIHAIHHVMHQLQWLEAWPSPDRRSRMVLIGQGIPRHFPTRQLAAVEAEVVDAYNETPSSAFP